MGNRTSVHGKDASYGPAFSSCCSGTHRPSPPKSGSAAFCTHLAARWGGAGGTSKVSGQGSPRHRGSLTFVRGPAVNERRLTERRQMRVSGESAHSRSGPTRRRLDYPAHLPTLRLLKRRSARMRVPAQERPRARACARRSRTAPPSSLPLRGYRRPNRKRAERMRKKKSL